METLINFLLGNYHDMLYAYFFLYVVLPFMALAAVVKFLVWLKG
jgi:hypothetical protein